MFQPREVVPGVTLRLLRVADAPALAEAYVRNRAHLAPWEPTRPETYFTAGWQAEDLAVRLEAARVGDCVPLGLFTDTALVGRLNLANIVRGPFQSGGIGYWIDGEHTGMGLASATVAAVIDHARDDLGLHRIEASTLLDNIGSQRVLTRNGFARIGTAPAYLQIAGRWRDHALFQRILHGDAGQDAATDDTGVATAEG